LGHRDQKKRRALPPRRTFGGEGRRVRDVRDLGLLWGVLRALEKPRPAVRKALSLCVHDLEPKACKVCNGARGTRSKTKGKQRKGRSKEGDGSSAYGYGRGRAKPTLQKRSSRETDPDERDELWKASVAAYNASKREEIPRRVVP
jgi:hypothetical protein